MYLLSVPHFIRVWMPKGLWGKPPGIQLSVYLTFDDGPHQEATPFVLDMLSKYKAKATFFCVGNNVKKYPTIYQRILEEGHTTGNHTFNHLNGWKTNSERYLEDIRLARQSIDSDLFRPPYGRIRGKQGKLIKETGMCLVYWSLLSGDFDVELSPSKCLQNVINHIKPGDIVVFHDSAKAFPRLQFVLPKVLEFCNQKGWRTKSL